MRNRLGRVLLWLLERVWPVPDDDPPMLVRAGGVYRHSSVEGDDLWIAEQQVQWWLEVGQQLREYAAHWPECRSERDDLTDARCSCGLLDVLGQVDEAVACTLAEGDEVAEAVADRRL